MRDRRAGITILASVALVAAMPSGAAADEQCNDAAVNPAMVTQPLHQLGNATGLQALSGVAAPVASGLQAAEQLPVGQVCATLLP